MSAAASSSNARVNLEHSTVLLIDDNSKSLDMLSSIFHGFGVKEQIKCENALEAAEIVKRKAIDLILVDCSMPEMDGYDFTRWLRREMPAPARYTPLIMLTGHAAQSSVQKSRDCGASFVVAKPLTPSVLLRRILWLGNDEREFVESENYVGPDRRVRNFGPPLGLPGRRAGDLSTHVGEPAEANMDQADIDMLMKPRRVSL
ncbi:response regulator [Brevundimonas sp. FT23042]|uniref:response regulator n=1 Tax=Brevundimonas sp. FT23042 TaxID=3393749 RepID=UPI003B586EFC